MKLHRRDFFRTAAAGTAALVSGAIAAPTRRPNIVFVFADEWRAQAFGHAGDPNVKTPHIDRLAAESLRVTHAISGCPVCTPYRGSLLTGRYPLSHGLFVNDVHLPDSERCMAEIFGEAGYATAYIGKWHVDGHGRSSFIPPERRQGFQYWKALECTHAYNKSRYFADDSPDPREWEGYDAIAQTRDAIGWIKARDTSKPFLLVLSWGPPHDPYETAPEKYRAMYDPAAVKLRPNVPAESDAAARRMLAGYYAHCTALDDCLAELVAALDAQGLADDTILVFTSDHGDMLGSQGERWKQRPWDESIRVPFLLRWPARFGRQGRAVPALLDAPDILPTLLGLCGVPAPAAIEGRDFTACLEGGPDPSGGAALIACYHPFGQWPASRGGREYRGLRTLRHTYARTLQGPWLLYDNETDPYQQRNLVDDPASVQLRDELDARLKARLKEMKDEFLPGTEYVQRRGYTLDATGTVPYAP